METINHNTSVRTYKNHDELEEEVLSLIIIANESAQNAYAPYSHYKVGAALLLNNGKIVTGNNQENAAYPSGLCAERTALFYASSQFPTTPFLKIAIASIHPHKKGTKPISPCGSCRQALIEYEQKFNQEIEVLLAAENGEVYV